MSERTPDISVIIPVFEQAGLLPLIIQCLAAQDYQGRWEILVCDDGSADDCRPILDKASRQYGWDIRYLWQPHRGRGVARSRNNGIRCARGEILIFLDGDGLIPGDFLSTHARMHSSERILYCGSRKILFAEPADMARLSSCSMPNFMRRCEKLDLISMRGWQKEIFPRSPWRVCMSCNMSVIKSDFTRFDENFIGWGSEDVGFACRLYSRFGYTIKIDPPSFVYSLEFSDDRDFPELRPKTHQEILDCIHDLLYIRSLYPDLDMEPLLRMGRYFAFDHTMGQWRQLPRSQAETRDVGEALQEMIQHSPPLRE